MILGFGQEKGDRLLFHETESQDPEKITNVTLEDYDQRAEQF